MHTASVISPEWKKWIKENLMRRRDPKELIQTMIDKQFDPVTALTGVLAEAAQLGGKMVDFDEMCTQTLSKASLSAEWKQWVATNVTRGCKPRSLLKIMAEHKLDAASSLMCVISESARHSLRRNGMADPGRLGVTPQVPEHVPEKTAVAPSSAPDWSKPRFTTTERLIHAYDRDVSIRMRMEKPLVVIFDDVMSPQECDELIGLARNRITRSTVVDRETGKSALTDQRTSSGTFLGPQESELVRRLDVRIAFLMQLPPQHGEDLQILRYEVGQQYKPHQDFFDPHQPSTPQLLAMGGQRVSTLVIYLNTPERGGETIFPKAGLSVLPKKGSAVYFEYCDRQGNLDYNTLHGGAPVIEGEKWVATKWMRYRRWR